MRILLLVLLTSFISWSQKSLTISGEIVDQKLSPLTNVIVSIEGTEFHTLTTHDGKFMLQTSLQGSFILHLSSKEYHTKRLPIELQKKSLDLGILTLSLDLTIEKSDNLITLTENDLFDDEGDLSSSVGLLQASRDLFLKRAAFDFGQAFFRVRGYDSKEGQLFINGQKMNKFFDGRPQWNNWGGLNDVIRNQEYTNGLEEFEYAFGGILGNTYINMKPSEMRPGNRISSSFSNRTYAGRFMATHTSSSNQKGISFSISASRRWANQGFLEGTLYDAFSFFSAIEYQFLPNNSLVLTAIAAKNRRGRSSAITQEVFELTGPKYNPYWGEQNGKIRNSRERDIFEPIVMLNHYFVTKNFQLNTGVLYQTGKRKRRRIGYFNASNPDPTYYRYLPSFYINNPIGADFTNADLARTGFLNNPQINWQQLYTANSTPENFGRASYVLQDDTVEDSQYSFSSIGRLNYKDELTLNFGLSFRVLDSNNFALLTDLLGAQFHLDIDPFTATRNDSRGKLEKQQGDLFSYNYFIRATEWNSFAQINIHKRQWNMFLSGTISGTGYQRDGLFLNERFTENSFGKSEAIQFSNFGIKTGGSFKITGRHWILGNAGLINRPPTLQNAFINPRENNDVVPNLQSEKINSLDLSYILRLPKIKGRLTGFYSRFQNTTDINFFFVDSGVGSDFVQEVITDLDKLHKGIELGFEYEASPQVKLSFAGNLGNYVYASDPKVTINFDTSGREEDAINLKGSENLGYARLKDLRLAQGPQTAFSIGIEYRDPNYWWIGATANYLAENYITLSTITRTKSFLLDPESGQPFPNATPENVNELLQQQPLNEFYLMNFVGGKSWLFNGTYISFFASINNLFNVVFQTGGFEQSRNGNFGQLQQDNLRNDPSFAPRYWYGFGRTFFFNLAVSF